MIADDEENDRKTSGDGVEPVDPPVLQPVVSIRPTIWLRRGECCGVNSPPPQLRVFHHHPRKSRAQSKSRQCHGHDGPMGQSTVLIWYDFVEEEREEQRRCAAQPNEYLGNDEDVDGLRACSHTRADEAQDLAAHNEPTATHYVADRADEEDEAAFDQGVYEVDEVDIGVGP